MMKNSGFSLFLLLCCSAVMGQTVYYAGPDAAAEVDAASTTATNPAYYLSDLFWRQVRTTLAGDDVVVMLVPGVYSDRCLWLKDAWPGDHTLTLRGQNPQGTVFRDCKENWAFRTMGVNNVAFEYLHFTGNIPNFAIHIQGVEDGKQFDKYCQHFRVSHCSFIDMPQTGYGAIGAAQYIADLTIEDCDFQRVGKDVHAHMLYIDHHIRGVRVLRNHFEDTPGDYTRFRNDVNDVSIIGNTYKSTTVEQNRPFVAMPLFGPEDPGTEHFGNGYEIRDNVFEYAPWISERTWDRGYAISFSNWGYQPPDREYYLPLKDAEMIQNPRISLQKRTELLRKHTGIDAARVVVSGNKFINAVERGVYGCNETNGAKYDGWKGFMPIWDLFTHE